MPQVAILGSGQGSHIAGICKAVPVSLFIADRKCKALKVAQEADLPAEIIPRKKEFTEDGVFDTNGFTAALIERLKNDDINMVVMAGFRTVLGKAIFDAFPDRITNIHPSLLPAFPGNYAVRDALAAGVKITGCTAHIATFEVDKPKPHHFLDQSHVRVFGYDDEKSLHERI